MLVADRNTYGVCGEAVKEQLGEKLENSQVFECEGYVIPNEEAVAAIEKKLTDKTDLIMGIGSGVIQDLCKYVWEEDIHRIYTGAADGVIALQKKLGWYEVDRLGIYEEKWEEIKKVLEEVPSSGELIRYLK